MDTAKKCFLIWIILGVFITFSIATENVKLDVSRNVVYIGQTVFEATLPSWKQCLELCTRMTICKSISFIINTKKCHIHSETPTSFDKLMVNSTGDFFALASTGNKELTGVCKEQLCKTTEISIESLSNGTSCRCQQISFRCKEGWTLWYGSCYLFVAQVMNYLEAKRECEKVGSSMVKIDNELENQYILSRAVALELVAIWIGASDLGTEGTWLWDSDGSVVGYSDWGKNEPNNYNDFEHCGAILLGNFHAKWIDDMCIKQYYFICEK